MAHRLVSYVYDAQYYELSEARIYAPGEAATLSISMALSSGVVRTTAGGVWAAARAANAACLIFLFAICCLLGPLTK